MSIQYRIRNRVHFRPPIIIPSRGFWSFDRISGKRIKVWKAPTTSPYHRVLVYQLKSTNFSILYKTRFYTRKNVCGWSISLYKHFILFRCATYEKNRKKYTHVLFDITKDRFQGKVVIPRKDICYMVSYLVIVSCHHGKMLISCRRQVHMTIYDSIESNLTGYLNLILRNGITIPPSRSVILPSITKSGDVYSFRRNYFNVYRRETRYQPARHLIEHTRLIRGRPGCNYRVDIWSDTLYIICIPGPEAIAFLTICDPVDGIARKRPSNNKIFREVIPSFHPLSKDADFKHFYFLKDGSLLHLIRSPKKTLSSADIYARKMS
jgi:hypothetical protein